MMRMRLSMGLLRLHWLLHSSKSTTSNSVLSSSGKMLGWLRMCSCMASWGTAAVSSGVAAAWQQQGRQQRGSDHGCLREERAGSSDSCAEVHRGVSYWLLACCVLQHHGTALCPTTNKKCLPTCCAMPLSDRLA